MYNIKWGSIDIIVLQLDNTNGAYYHTEVITRVYNRLRTHDSPSLAAPRH